MAGDRIIKVVGVGGSGCATVERMMGCGGCELVAVHTDAASLLQHKGGSKVLIGLNVTKGRSTGNNIRLGEEAAISDLDKIKAAVGSPEVTFIVAGLGGGTGAGASPVVAEAAKGQGSMVVAFVNIPFTAEGKVCRSNALTGLDNMKPYCDLIVVIQNDRFLKVVPDLSIRDAFTKVNHMLLEAVRGMVKLVNESGVDNLKPLLKGYAAIGHGVGPGLRKAVEAALDSPLIGADVNSASGVLLNFTTHSKALADLQEALDSVAGKVSPSAAVVWTNTVDDSAEAVEVLALFSGVKLAL